MKNSSKQMSTTALLIVGLAGISCLVATEPTHASSLVARISGTHEQSRQDAKARYEKWLKEDVAYLITDEERDAFQGLKTDQEREQFIEQFWQRRNPSSRPSENKFKTEHYRRLAYANEHFAFSIPGWKTDRGRIYIVYGPPDKIEDGQNVQRWHYPHIDGVGDDAVIEFARPNSLVDFRVISRPSLIKK